jgi:hypothetical protein
MYTQIIKLSSNIIYLYDDHGLFLKAVLWIRADFSNRLSPDPDTDLSPYKFCAYLFQREIFLPKSYI